MSRGRSHPGRGSGGPNGLQDHQGSQSGDRGHYLARGGHEITIPRGGSEGFGPKFEGLLKKYLAAQSERVYIVKPGDSLSAIADRFGVPLTSLLVGNRLDVTRPIHPGQEIIVFQHDVPSVGSDLDQAEQ